MPDSSNCPPIPEKRTRRKYSDEEKASVLALRAFNGDMDFPTGATATALHIPDSNIDAWQQGRGISPAAIKLVGERKIALADLCEQFARQSLESLLSSGHTITPRDMVSIAIAIDKMLLLRGSPTAISEQRRGQSDYQRELAAQALALVREKLGLDAEQALAYLRENQPELAGLLAA